MYECIVTVAELKALLGIGENEYSRWDNLKNEVIKVCQQALKEKTDICFTYEPYARSGRGGRIHALRFTITKNADYKNQLNLEKFIDAKIIEDIKQEAQQEQELALDVSCRNSVVGQA